MNVKHGFSTLNRLLGKKNKNGQNLSKSTTNLSSLSIAPSSDTTLISSQEPGRIRELPAIVTNAPFEQNFRITVLLPRDQLYVARLGAKTKLEKLLQLVCENKQLDPEKYEFRHPGDNSQVFSSELTIGTVGLTEIRLCHKSEAYDNFDADEIIKLRHTAGRDSLSSSEQSSRNSKHTLKTASPYSSTNSLNSVDSTGMNSSYRGAVVSLPPQSAMGLQIHTRNGHHGHILSHHTNNNHHNFQPPVAPARKKRVAPRPPSQNSIPEKDTINPTTNGTTNKSSLDYKPAMPRKEFHVSSPNLTQCTELSTLRTAEFHKSNISVDCNGNNNSSHNNNFQNGSLSYANSNGYLNQNGNESPTKTPVNGFEKVNLRDRPMSMHVLNYEMHSNGLGNGHGEKSAMYSSGSVSNLSGNGSSSGMPEPTPRKRIFQAKKKAPAAPPRGLPPIASPRSTITAVTVPVIDENETEREQPKPVAQSEVKTHEGKALSQIETIKPDILAEVPPPSGFQTAPSSPQITLSTSSPPQSATQVESKPQINGKPESAETVKNSPVETPRINGIDSKPDLTLEINKKPEIPNTNTSPIESPKTTVENPEIKLKSRSEETSSDEETQMKVYNLKLGKTIIKPVENTREVNQTLEVSICTTDNESLTPLSNVSVADSNSIRSESPAWSHPIPAPPTFADNSPEPQLRGNTKTVIAATVHSPPKSPDIPITPKINDHKPYSFEQFKDVSKIPTVDQENVISSDIEDGYRVGLDKTEPKFSRQTLLETLSGEKMVNSSPEPANSSLESGMNGHQETIPKDFMRECSPSPPNSLESFGSNKTDVVSELKNVLNSNGLDTLIRSKVEQNDENVSVHPAALENFKIQSYVTESNGTGSPVNSESSESKYSKLEICNFNSPSAPVEQVTKSTREEVKMAIPSEVEEMKSIARESEPAESANDEKLFKKYSPNKRSSITLSNNIANQLFRSPASISRSDSFHSTRKQDSNGTLDPITSRSSSYIALSNSSKVEHKTNLAERFLDTNRRKSSSELSIGESPSLQSLIVMKSILSSGIGSRGSLNMVGVEEQKTPVTQNAEVKVNGHRESVENPIPSRSSTALGDEMKKDESDLPKNNKVISTEVTTFEKLDKKEGSERKWKYQGPPSINLSTWSERPKVQVAIKNDSDYKFGGSSPNTTPRNSQQMSHHRNSMQFEGFPRLKTIDPAAAPPETVKVLPMVRSVELKKSISTDTPTETVTHVQQTNSEVSVISINSVEQPKTSSTTMTLGRMPKIYRSNFVPIVKGFKNIENTVKTEASVEPPVVVGKVNENQNHHQNGWKTAVTTNQTSIRIERSNSKPSNQNILKSSTNENILNRRESLKSVSTLQISQTTPKNGEMEAPFSQKILRRTGLKEKILASNESEMAPTKGSLEKQSCAKLELKLTTTNITTNGSTSPTVKTLNNCSQVPPPPPPIIRSVITKTSAPNSIESVGSADSRGQLLDAIRGFNKNSLKRN